MFNVGNGGEFASQYIVYQVHNKIYQSLVDTTNFAKSNQSNNREIELSNFETNKDFLP